MSLTAPDPAKSLLLTIDVQVDFTNPGAPAEVAGTAAAVPNMIRLIEGFRELRRPIVHMVRLYKPDGSNVDLCRQDKVREGWDVARPGSSGADLVTEFGAPPLDAEVLLRGEAQKLRAGEWALYKPRWGAFYQTTLEQMISWLGVNTLVVCGCNFPNCPRASIYEASERDLRVIVASDALSGFYERGRQELEDIGVVVGDTDTCLTWLSR